MNHLEQGRPGEVLVETCDNCGRTIGNLETPYLHEGHIVCAECKQRLSPSRPDALSGRFAFDPATNEASQQPLDQLAQASANRRRARPIQAPQTHRDGGDSTVWRNLSWLGVAMFGAGAILEVNGAHACGYFGLLGLVIWLVCGVVYMSKR